MGLEIKRFLAHALTRAVLLNVAVLLALLLSYELLAAANLDTHLVSPLSLCIIGLSIISIAYFRFNFNVIKVRGSKENDSFPANRCIALVAIFSLALVWTSALLGNEMRLAIAAPAAILMEEVIFRGLPLILMLGLRASSVAKIGIALVSSVSFAALHASSFVAMYADRFIFSILAMVLAVKFQSLWPSVLYHLLANIVAMSIAAPLYNEDQAWIYIPIDLAIFALVFIMCSRRIIKRAVSERIRVKL